MHSRMPTGSKLVAAICLAVLGAVVAELVKEVILREMTYNFGSFTPVSAVIGAVVGWRVMGRHPGGSVVDAINNGITGVVVLVVAGLFVFGSIEMLDQSLRHRFSEPMEAVRAVLEIGIDYGAYLIDVKVVGALVVGAIVSGVLTGIAHHRWR